MTPLERYQHDLQQAGFSFDAAQQHAVQHLQSLYERLLEQQTQASDAGVLSRLSHALFKNQPKQPVKGLYFWGGVGRGKTYLMDCFYEALPFKRKLRLHFHRFMLRVHDELRLFAGSKNPLQQVADKLAAETVVLCFDELFVTDITDAMILGGLFEALFQRGVTLVATSNVVPDNLYKEGLQRGRFLPTIALLKQHTDIIHLDSGIDYRLRALQQAGLYFYPLDDTAEQHLQALFDQLRDPAEKVEQGGSLTIAGRAIDLCRRTANVAWFTFTALCDGPRSQNDYIALAQQFYAVIVSGVPQLVAEHDDQARRFISLVDEFYDHNVKLVLAAAVPLEKLYHGHRLAFEFQRTRSRLLEMQSCEYLVSRHKA